MNEARPACTSGLRKAGTGTSRAATCRLGDAPPVVTPVLRGIEVVRSVDNPEASVR